MSRLTKSGGKFVSCNIDDECTGACGLCKKNSEIRHKLRYYEDLEEQGRLAEVIRCKDCIRHGDEHIGAGWCDEHEHLTNDDDYCSYAVAKLAEVECAE